MWKGLFTFHSPSKKFYSSIFVLSYSLNCNLMYVDAKLFKYKVKLCLGPQLLVLYFVRSRKVGRKKKWNPKLRIIEKYCLWINPDFYLHNLIILIIIYPTPIAIYIFYFTCFFFNLAINSILFSGVPQVFRYTFIIFFFLF